MPVRIKANTRRQYNISGRKPREKVIARRNKNPKGPDNKMVFRKAPDEFEILFVGSDTRIKNCFILPSCFSPNRFGDDLIFISVVKNNSRSFMKQKKRKKTDGNEATFLGDFLR